MSRVDEALNQMILDLEYIGHSTEDAIELVNKDIDKAKKEIEDYWQHIDDRIETYIESQVDMRIGRTE